ncbi:MAG: hypothetical protein WAM92_11575, partial [Mycobacterium sp.]
DAVIDSGAGASAGRGSATRSRRGAAAAQGPAWGVDVFVAYLDTSPESSLVVSDLDNRSPKRVATGVDTFAWAPPSR